MPAVTHAPHDIHEVDEDDRAVLRDLPSDRVGVVGLAEVGYSAARLAQRHHLNEVSAEALAVALALDAPIVVAAVDGGPPLRTACAAAHVEHLPVEV